MAQVCVCVYKYNDEIHQSAIKMINRMIDVKLTFHIKIEIAYDTHTHTYTRVIIVVFLLSFIFCDDD